MNALNVATRRGTVLNGTLFLSPVKADILVIAITGIHGNFYSNPFYYDIGDALNAAGIDFAYAQTRNAFGVVKTRNVLAKKEEMIGSPENRARILVEILAAMRERTRPGFVVAIKINSDDCQPGGLAQDDFLAAGTILSDAEIDAIEVSANYTSRPNIRAGVNECSFLPAAEALAAIVKTPVVLVGGVRSLETANAVLAKTAIQYIAMSRPLIREPNLINRWQAGDICPSTCVSCNACYRTSAHACLFTASH